MPDSARTLALAQRFRRDAEDTELHDYARRMLLAAQELEEFIRLRNEARAAPGRCANAANMNRR
ncbi:MAG TPA: hypothetical protein VK515_08385 [Rhizomicrobium sp.]|nr:hypothetical protein [Rhizomicrobium sp.]